MNPTITDHYREMNSQLHQKMEDYGAGLQTSQWYPMIAALAQKMKCVSILDYGCGKGAFGQAYPHLMVEGYDPAIPGIDETPEPHDFVICLDVLEHIEPDLLDNVLDDLQRCAKRAVFLTVNMVPARKVLPDGRNAHLIQERPEWWLPKLMARWEIRNFGGQPHEFNFFGVTKEQQQIKSVAA